MDFLRVEQESVTVQEAYTEALHTTARSTQRTVPVIYENLRFLQMIIDAGPWILASLTLIKMLLPGLDAG
jgi:hypothetical protein